MKNKRIKLLSLLVIIAIICINIIGYYNQKIDISMNLTFATVITAFGLYIIITTNKEFIFDLRFIVVGFYYLYNYYVPLVYILNDNKYITYMNKNNFSFSHETLLNAMYNSNIYLIGLILGTTLLVVKRKDLNLNTKRVSINFWLIIYSLANIWYIYPYFKIGIREALELDRWSRYIVFGQIKNVGGIANILNLFFSNILILLAIAMICKSYLEDINSKYKKFIFYIVVILQSMFWLFIDVRRREVLYLVIIIFLLYKLTFNFKIRSKHILALIAIGSMFLGYQYVKNYFPVLIKDGFSAAIEQYKVDNSRKNSTEKLLQNEFGMVYVNNLYIADNYIEKENGRTYIEATLKNIPFFDYILYEWLDFERTYIISDIMTEGYADIYNSGGGLGFSPSAEAAVNFGNGSFGVMLIGFLTGGIISFLMVLFYKPKYIILYSLLLVQGVNFCRITLVGVTQEVIWIFIYYIMYRTVENIIFKRNKSIRRINNV